MRGLTLQDLCARRRDEVDDVCCLNREGVRIFIVVAYGADCALQVSCRLPVS